MPLRAPCKCLLGKLLSNQANYRTDRRVRSTLLPHSKMVLTAGFHVVESAVPAPEAWKVGKRGAMRFTVRVWSIMGDGMGSGV